MNPTEPIRLIISLVELSERCSSGVTVQGTKLDNLYYHKFYPLSVFSLAENLQLILGISTTYGYGRQSGRLLKTSDSQSDGPRVRVPLWPLAGFVLGRPQFKSTATLVSSQLVAFCQLGLLNSYVTFDLFVSKHLSGAPVN